MGGCAFATRPNRPESADRRGSFRPREVVMKVENLFGVNPSSSCLLNLSS
jgi:hypothetical protein